MRSHLTEDGCTLPRITQLAPEEFLSKYLLKNQPIIISDAMRNWAAATKWTPQYFTERFGNEQVQVYGDLFRLMKITSLSDYLRKYFKQKRADVGSTPAVPYVRWYSHLLGDERVPWADEVFRQLEDDWSRPYFFPAHSYVLPYCAPRDKIDPSRNWFPARGLFISGQGARTRLHADPWCSDALLCQMYGQKDFVMYDPGQAKYLTNGSRSVDVDAPDLTAFPDFPQARPFVCDVLRPGEMLLVPAGWFHHFKSTTDSISLTWNFVHQRRLPDFLSYLAAGPPETELKQLHYAYFESPGRRALEHATLQLALSAAERNT